MMQCSWGRGRARIFKRELLVFDQLGEHYLEAKLWLLPFNFFFNLWRVLER